MLTYRTVVRETGKALANSKLGKHPAVTRLWNGMRWQEIAQEAPNEAAAVDTELPKIALYPGLLQKSDYRRPVLREFGRIILAKGGSRSATIWGNKFDLATKQQVDAAQKTLSDLKIRARCKTYEQAKDTYPDTGACVDRLVFIHIANAFLANNVPFSRSGGIDIRQFGPTAEFCTQRKYFSLVPLVSAYCPREVFMDFGAAFAAMVLDDLACCSESSVAEALRRIVTNVTSRLEKHPTAHLV